MKNKNLYSERRIMRMQVVAIIYQFELLNQTPNSKDVFENDRFAEIQLDLTEYFPKNRKSLVEYQMKIITTIEKQHEKFQNFAKSFIRSDWTWTRINPLLRAIILCAMVEAWNLEVGIVTNEYIEIAKDFFPEGEEYKFVNKVVQEVGKKYNEIKKARKQN